jgi:4-hydroxy-2-oxoglutarate aldolase
MGGSADYVIQTLVGGHGVIAELANIAPRASLQVIELFLHEKAEEARETQAIVARGDWVAIKGDFVAVKAALNMYYSFGGEPRRRYVAPVRQAQAVMRELLNELMDAESRLESSK